LAKDVKNELEAALDILAGKGKGAKGKAPRGAERKKMWEEVKALRKEYVILSYPHDRRAVANGFELDIDKGKEVLLRAS
jgi:hypothetical protein